MPCGWWQGEENADELVETGDRASDALKTADQSTEAAETATDAGKHAEALDETGDTTAHLLKDGEAATEVPMLADNLFAVGQNAASQRFRDLDPQTIELYNSVIQKYNNAANGSETITYFRVQGGVKDPVAGLNRSEVRIFPNDDGTAMITKPTKPLSISAYTLDHVNYYKGTREASAHVIAMDVPLWYDELMRENAVLQDNYTKHFWNQGGMAPKLPDINKAGYPYELPPPWPEWLGEVAYNVRYVDLGDPK